MRKIAFPLLLAYCLVAAAPGRATDPDVVTSFGRAEHYFAAGDYVDAQKVTPMFIPNFYLSPFADGAATEPAFVMPHRPPPPYPFPLAGV
jgi:hypothetical protein